jgi:hypothetical protein
MRGTVKGEITDEAKKILYHFSFHKISSISSDFEVEKKKSL